MSTENEQPEDQDSDLLPDNGGQRSDKAKVNPQLASELAALEAEAGEGAASSSAGIDTSTPAGQWEAALVDIMPPVFVFIDPENELEMKPADFRKLAKGVSPALGKHFPDLSNFLKDIPPELTAALTVGMVLVPKVRKVKAKRAAEAAKEVKPDADATQRA